MSASLLEKQSTGGAIARVGFDYQDAFLCTRMYGIGDGVDEEHVDAYCCPFG